MSDKNMVLHNADCMKVLEKIETESVDLFITDPPYRITARGNEGNSGGMLSKKEVQSGKIFDHNDLDIADWIEEVYRILKNDSHCYIMTNNKNIGHYLSVIEKSNFSYVKNLIWAKNNKIMGNSYMSQFEYIIMCRKGKHKKINHCGTSDLLAFPNKKMKDEHGKTIHDTEKPVGLMEVLVENSSEVGDVVLDAFMGIGATGVACKKLGRSFIGCEISPQYYGIAQKRISLENQTGVGESEGEE